MLNNMLKIYYLTIIFKIFDLINRKYNKYSFYNIIVSIYQLILLYAILFGNLQNT